MFLAGFAAAASSGSGSEADRRTVELRTAAAAVETFRDFDTLHEQFPYAEFAPQDFPLCFSLLFVYVHFCSLPVSEKLQTETKKNKKKLVKWP